MHIFPLFHVFRLAECDILIANGVSVYIFLHIDGKKTQIKGVSRLNAISTVTLLSAGDNGEGIE